MSPVVGFVGLGHMGHPMARNLAAAGFDMVVFDLDRDACAGFAESHGATAGGDAGAVFRAADTVITMLPNGRAVRAVAEAGIAAVPEGRGRLIVDMSSSAPHETAELARTAAAHGYAVVDAPVSGGVGRAETGDLSILAGGAGADVDRCEPIFEVLGRETFRVGPVGAGHAMKALNNVMSAAGLLLAAETILVGRRYGLEPEVMLKVLNASTGMNHATQTKIAQYVLSGTYASGFALDLMVKDLATAGGIARAAGAPYLMGSAVTSVWELAGAQLPPGADQMRLVRWLEDLAGTRLGP
ncbi:NAD(P)-dependent oxidoreductase [Phytohabitans suffuscus]|uniref:Oxidoreductase n=1 Tax=Phytohabitans suffuscus TaxID=624315 RepID=A0A6F8YVY1_9ACTN|nr:NAD(P)-dependent oxidoreductase [Phytohabitans suffuscus]BCB90011.1 oxidoreductase [Phytohabitans suffuscus]